MPADESQDETASSGKGLRERLEEVLRENRELKDELVVGRAQTLISESNLKFVKPEDLKGVALADLAAKAAEVEAVKAAQAKEVLTTTLRARGLDEAEIEGTVAQLLGETETAERTESLSLLRQVTKVPGSPAPVEQQNVFGQDRIEAALAKKSKSSKR